MPRAQFVWCDTAGTERNVFALFRRSFTLPKGPGDSAFMPGSMVELPTIDPVRAAQAP